ncbi:hypothetical protein KY285_001405 [Solanum tuberosum]|nr:hypothetical protein KY285_001405 [Solanum tuberosum]
MSYIAPTIDHNHPLYLNPNDIPSSSLISLKLTSSENYAIWSIYMRIGLVGKSKLSFIDGRFPKSKFTPDLFDIREKCNVVILTWIMIDVRPELLSSVVYVGDAHGVWCDLSERFEKIKGAHVYQLHKEIHSITQGLWSEYDSIMPCPGCAYPASKKFQEHCEYMRVLEFLMGLNDTYSVSKSQILLESLIPSLNKKIL